MMFGRFTERAQKVLALAQEEALRLGHNNIGTEHILLGIVREGEGIAAKALSALGLSTEKIQKEVEALIGRGQEFSEPDRIPERRRGGKGRRERVCLGNEQSRANVRIRCRA